MRTKRIAVCFLLLAGAALSLPGTLVPAGAVTNARQAETAPMETWQPQTPVQPEEEAVQKAEETLRPEQPAKLTLDAVRAVTFSDLDACAQADRDAVGYLAYRNILLGVGEDVFSPDEYVDRATVATALFRMAGAEEAPEPAFPDVPEQAWFAPGACWASSRGVIQGFPDGLFQPRQPVDRSQLAAMFYRYAAAVGAKVDYSGNLEGYWDKDAVPDYAVRAMTWASQNGIFASLISPELHPDYLVTRGQLAQVLTALAAHCTYEPVARAITQESWQESRSRSRENHAALQSAVEAAGREYGAIGLQAAVIENGRVTDAFSWGWANRYGIVEYNQAGGRTSYGYGGQMTPRHKLRVASLSKVLVGMNAMALSEEGAVELDAGIGRYWGCDVKNPYYPSDPVSVRSLLTHTSSLPVYGDAVSLSHGAVYGVLSGGRFERRRPGAVSSWSYNNYAFSALGMTLELACGSTLDEVSARRFFRPLDIDAAFEAGSIQHTDLLCTLYGHDGGVLRSAAAQKRLTGGSTPGGSGNFFAGGLTISAPDLAKLFAALSNDGVYEGQRILSAASVAAMETPVGTPAGQAFEQCQPLRLQHNIYGRKSLYYHTGSAYGVYTCASYDPEAKDGVVVFSTGASGAKDGYGIYAVCGQISKAVYDTLCAGA